MSVSALNKAWLRRAALACAPVVLGAQTPPPPPTTPMPPEVIKFMGSGSFLGVGVREIDSSRAKALNLREEFGVEVTTVEPGSPAEKAGLKVGDVVQEYQGQRVEGTEQFVRLVRETPAGRAARLTIVRNGSAQSLTATIGSRKDAKTWAHTMPMEGFRFPDRDFNMVMPDVPKAMMSWRSGMLGIEGESLSESQLASFFGVKDGVLVRSVLKDSAAEKAGIKAGDVILKVDDKTVTTPRDVTAAIRSATPEGKKTFPILVMRDRKEITLTVTMSDEPHGLGTAPRSRSVTTVRSPL